MKWVLGSAALGITLTGAYLLIIAFRSLKAGRYPPPGMKVIKDTRIKIGRQDKIMAYLLIFNSGAIILLIGLVLFLFCDAGGKNENSVRCSMSEKNRLRRVALLIFDEVEVLDFCGPFEVFSVTGVMEPPQPFQVYTVAETLKPVIARKGLSVNPSYQLSDCPVPDILLIPGGLGTRREMHNTGMIDWIRDQAVNTELVLSVCTGALMLAKAGLLDGLEATTPTGRSTCSAKWRPGPGSARKNGLSTTGR